VTRRGGCLCGAVRYAVQGPLRAIIVCHCSECLRWTGRAWPATAARVADVEIVDTGTELRWLASPRSVSGADRGFCARCGTSLFWRVPGEDRVSISAGTLDDAAGLHVAAHIWCEHRAAWEPSPENVPAHPRGYPDDAAGALPWS
jgi:hypothetical protein